MLVIHIHNLKVCKLSILNNNARWCGYKKLWTKVNASFDKKSKRLRIDINRRIKEFYFWRFHLNFVLMSSFVVHFCFVFETKIFPTAGRWIQKKKIKRLEAWKLGSLIMFFFVICCPKVCWLNYHLSSDWWSLTIVEKIILIRDETFQLVWKNRFHSKIFHINNFIFYF